MRWLAVLVLVAGCGKLFGIENIPYAGDAAPPDSPPDAPLLPKLQLGSTSFDFGSIVDGKASFAVAIQVTNVGDATTGTLAFTKAGGAPGDFAILDDSGCIGTTLDAGVGCTFSIVFAPSTSGDREATLDVSDSVVMASATFKGKGLVPGALDMSPSPANFGMHGVGSNGTVMITLTNTGQTTLSLVSMAMTDVDAAFSFTPSAGCATSDSLAGGASCTIAVKFAPPLGGSHVASLQVTTDAAVGATSAASLGGTGTSTATVMRLGTGTGVVASSANEITCGATCSATFATPMLTLHGTPDSLNALTAWSTNCNSTSSSCSVPTDRAAIEVDATFTVYPHVTVAVTGTPGEVMGPNGLDCTNSGGTCSVQVVPNAPFTLVPSSTGTSSFSVWGGSCAGSPSTCSLVATGDKSATATFATSGNDYVLNLVPGPGTNPDGTTAAINGAQTPCQAGLQCTYHYAQPTSFTLSPVSDQCMMFTGFSGDCDNQLTHCNVSMTAGQHVYNVTYTYTEGSMSDCTI